MRTAPIPPSSADPALARLDDAVVADVLERHYRNFPRALLIASLFALLTVVLLRNALPAKLLLGWLAIFVGMNALRLRAARAFLATPPSLRIERRWPRLAVIGHCAGGAAWGVLGATLVLLRPDAPEYLLVSLFVVAIFAVGQAANPSRYPPAY